MGSRSTSRHAHNEAQQQAFDRVAPLFEQAPAQEILKRLEVVVDSARIQPNESILDVGTGTGVLLPFILEHLPSRVLACDLSKEMLKRAGDQFGNRVGTLQADVVDIPVSDSPFDVIFCNAAFGNVYDQKETLAAMDTLLAPTGRLVISHPMGSAFVKRLQKESPQYHLKDLPNKAQLKQLLRGTRLRMVHFIDEPDFYMALSVKSPE